MMRTGVIFIAILPLPVPVFAVLVLKFIYSHDDIVLFFGVSDSCVETGKTVRVKFVNFCGKKHWEQEGRDPFSRPAGPEKKLMGRARTKTLTQLSVHSYTKRHKIILTFERMIRFFAERQSRVLTKRERLEIHWS